MLRPAFKANDQNDRQHAKTDNTVGVTEPVTADGEHSRDELILRQIDCQERKCGITRIRCQDQNQRCCALDEEVHEVAAKYLLSDFRDDCDLVIRRYAVIISQRHNSCEQQCQQYTHCRQRLGRVVRRRRFEVRDGIGDRLNPGQRRAP
ncbi:hypothetical protein D3C73_1100430 [compost metagenome]